MNIDKVHLALEKVKPGLDKYIAIMDRFRQVDVSSDRDFQRMFNGFYKVRQRPAEFYNKFYCFMEENKNVKPSYEKTIEYLYAETGRVEASFASKLIATIDPNQPIIDSEVSKNLGIKKTYSNGMKKVADKIKIYLELKNWYEGYLVSEEGEIIIKLFNQRYPDANITDTKKIDFVLWKTRD